MSLDHLSDDQIQSYIDKKDTSAERHLRVCEECRHTYRHYVLLNRKLAQLPDISLSPAFSQNVMAAIRVEEPVVDHSSWSLIGISTIILLITSITTVWLIGWQKSATFLQGLLPELAISDYAAYQSMLTFVETYASVIGILIFAGIIIMFFSVLEKLLAKVKSTRLSIFSI